MIVPGVGTAPPNKWINGSGNWLASLFDVPSSRTQVLWYDYQVNQALQSPVLEQLIEEGKTFIDAVNKQCVEGHVSRREKQVLITSADLALSPSHALYFSFLIASGV